MRYADYQRVLPRDLFNEAKLLKCLGRLSLLLHDGHTGCKAHLVWDGEDKKGFEIKQDPSSGNLGCATLVLLSKSDKVVHLSTVYNSKLTYPLIYEMSLDDGDELTGYVFYEFGEFTAEFLEATDR